MKQLHKGNLRRLLIILFNIRKTDFKTPQLWLLCQQNQSVWFTEHSCGQTQTKGWQSHSRHSPGAALESALAVAPLGACPWEELHGSYQLQPQSPSENMTKGFPGCFLISLFALRTATGTWRGIGIHQGARAFMATPHLCHLQCCCHSTAHSQLDTVPWLKPLLWGQIIISYIMWPLARVTKAFWGNQHAWN